MIKAGIIGGAGYTGGEVFRLLLNHPEAEISFVQSESQAGKKIHSVHRDCFGWTELEFTDEMKEADALFLCKGHGESKEWLKKNKVSEATKIIDLSTDFRHKENSSSGERSFVYGLPELNKQHLKQSSSVANPGCFATCIQLALLPLASEGLLNSDVHVNATTGSTGAGQSLSETSHFTWRNNNLSAYKTMEHQHEKEIGESLNSLQSLKHQLYFVPQRGAFTRGIHAVSYLHSDLPLERTMELYTSFYTAHPFTHVVPFEVDLKQVVNTNNCFISLSKVKDRLVIVSAIDNLLKGAAGQAVQNMNLMFGLSEASGLHLKPSNF